MAIIKKIKRIEKKVCIGSMNKLIRLKVRSLTPPLGDTPDFGETFSQLVDVWAMVETIVGEEIFDDSNVRRLITHDFYIRYLQDITFELWLLYPAQIGNTKELYFDILKVENLNMENEFLKLRCSDRGDATKQVNWN
jgi:head-tail adaptor